jgi:hypothetical protein
MESIFKCLIFIVGFQVLLITASAQTERQPVFSEKGGIIGYGYGVSHLNIPEGKYTPLFFMGHFGIDLLKAKKTAMPQRFTLFFEPQVNPVILQRPGANGHSMEFGANVGVQHMYPVSRNFYLYILISTGPHFITVHTGQQARGFIFSDNMGAGTYFYISKNLALNTGFRIRHMSNANLEMPNHGINTMNFFIGISHLR